MSLDKSSPNILNHLHNQRRSPNEHNRPGKVASTLDGSTMAGSKAGAKCKRATTTELINSLNPRNVDEQHPLMAKANCGVYHLLSKIDNEEVVLKVIQIDGRRRTKEKTEREAWGLHNVQQLVGWAHTSDEKMYYLFMKNMGVSLYDTPFVDNRQQVRKLQDESLNAYSSQYHLKHNDHVFDFEDTNNWVFREVGSKWQAELIDWEAFIEESGYEGYTDPPKPFLVDEKCVFVPWKMKVHYD